VGDLAATDRIPRRVPVPALRPSLEQCLPTGVGLAEGSRVVVAVDEGGVGAALAKKLTGRGATVLELDPAAGTDDLRGQVEAFAAEGRVDGVYWLAALDDEGAMADLELADWREGLRRRVKTLYTTMRALYEHNPFLVSATRLGGMHGYDPAGATAPMGGSVTGFTKAYQKERMLEARGEDRIEDSPLVKAVDFAQSRKTAALADVLIDETLRDPGCVEVGYADGARWGIGLLEQPFPAEPTAEAIELTPDTVAVVTGAAGSIVSAIVADLARAAGGGTFHLIDLTPQPDPQDESLAAYINDRDAFKLQVAAKLKAKGERPTPVTIDRALAGYERLEAALAAIQAVEAAGGTVRYHAIDLTDPAQVGAVIDEIRESSGRIDLLLHAAGTLQDRRLPGKEPRMFDLVVDVKSDGWFNLLKAAGDMPVRATVGFSSVAGRFGNSAQTDYAAANDLLCKTTSAFRTSRPGTRGYALDWTAWGGIGMATRGSVAAIMDALGVEMLPPEAGVAWIRRELTSGTPAGEVVVAGALGAFGEGPSATGGLDPAALDVSATGPMVGEVVAARALDGLVVRTTLDPTEQPFLNDHRGDRVTALLPGVMGIEGMVEVASLLAPQWHVAAVEDVDFIAPLKYYRDEPRTLEIIALTRPKGDELVAECRVEAERQLPGQDAPTRTTHFTGRVRLTRESPQGEQVAPPERQGPQIGPDDVYRMYFHGPAYQVVAAGWRADGGAAAEFAGDVPANHVPAEQPLQAAPRLIELCFQAAGLWEAGTEGRLALPTHADRVVVLSPGAEAALGEGGGLVATARHGEHGFDCLVTDAEGHVAVRLEGYRTVALQPLAEDLQAPFAAAMSTASE
jgi:NAD(P)-dependent dehydrogenase (short-subunit alcohol dehydrogenase family)